MNDKKFYAKYGRLPTERDWVYLREVEREKLMSKFQILSRPLMHPGRCVGCLGNTEDGRKYVDTGADAVEYLGADTGATIYICSFCVREIARVLFPELFEAPVAPPPVAEKDYAAELKNTLSMMQEFINAARTGNPPSPVDVSSDNPELHEEPEPESSGESEREDDGDEPTTSGQNPGSHVPSLAELLGTSKGNS